MTYAGNGSITTATYTDSPSREKDVGAAIARLEQTLERLLKVETEVVTRLAPIFRPFPVEVPSVDKQGDIVAPLAVEISRIEQKLSRATSGLQEVLDHLEI